MRLRALLDFVRRDVGGTMAIETAIVAPVLIILSAGGFEVSRMVARQGELQGAAAEAAAIVRAAAPDTQAKLDTIEDVIETSTDLADNRVTLSRVYRCGTDAAYVPDSASCANVNTVSSFIRIQMSDEYTPAWTHFGIGSGFSYNVDQTVQVS